MYGPPYPPNHLRLVPNGEEEIMTSTETDPPVKEAPPPVGSDPGSRLEAKPEDPLYVPVVNINYIPEGAPDHLEGFVPGHPGDDRTLNRIAVALETQGYTSGPEENPPGPPAEEPEPETTAEPEPEAPSNPFA